MARISILPDAVASRIAAGEVVERPASALKELLENAIDAGARTIDIQLESGGRDSLTVIDDGEGMSADDILLSLERHATSKIRSDADLETVASLGFRGEAVPSIASVSRFRISSRDAGSQAATAAVVHGGVLVSVGQEPAPRGTRVEVGALFFNTPARRKFLRSADTEKQRCVEVVARCAIGYPSIRFRLVSDGREVLDHAAVESPYERCAQVLGRPMTEALLTIESRSGPLAMVGLASGLSETRAHTRDQHFYVNRRPVRDRLLSHAVLSAYAEVLPRGRQPILVVLLEIPPALVDVNVHPSKAEVRFRQPSEIHQFVASGLRRTLREAGAVPSAAGSVSSFDAAPGTQPFEAREPAAPRASWEPGSRPLDLPGAWGFTYTSVPLSQEPPRPAPGPSAGPHTSFQGSAAPSTGGGRIPSIAPLGQFLSSYILASGDGALLLIDQHAAHERVLYERILRDSSARTQPAQKLLVPCTMELPPSERRHAMEILPALGAAGFDIEPFGEGALLLRGLPAGVEHPDPERVTREVLSDLREGRAVGAASGGHRIAASVACHAAIKIHAPLTMDKMAWLVEELFQCETPTTCPHGRPIVLRIGREDIERGFHRR